MEENLIWQTRDEMDSPTNPLQELREILTRTSRDTSEDKMIACIYGIIVGWDNASYEELKVKHGWNDKNIQWQKLLNENYKKAWNIYMANNYDSMMDALSQCHNLFEAEYEDLSDQGKRVHQSVIAAILKATHKQ